MSLTCTKLSFAYRTATPVLREVSAAFPPAQVTAVLGPNGSGKSTLLRMLLGELKPTAGRVTIDGRDAASLRGADVASRLAYIAQRADTRTPLTVGQYVALGRYAVGASASAVDGAVRLMELDAQRDQPVGELSAGQQQRAALARVAAQWWPVADAPGHTRVVLADEPASNLDPLHATRALRTLREWSRRAGLCVVVVMHDLTSALRYADRALVLDGLGRVAAEGQASEVLSDAVLRPVFGVGFARLGEGEARALVPIE